MSKPDVLVRETVSPPPFSMTDEEGDLPAFQSYLHALSPDALWDVWDHLDKEHYPRRTEATAREMQRRRLFFISPYTQREKQLRAFAFTCVFFAVLAAFANAMPALSALTAQVVRAFGGAYAVAYSGGPRLVISGQLSPGEARLVAALLPPLRGITLGAIATLVLFTLGVLRAFLRRKLHRDIFVTLVCALIVSGVFLRLAYT